MYVGIPVQRKCMKLKWNGYTVCSHLMPRIHVAVIKRKIYDHKLNSPSTTRDKQPNSKKIWTVVMCHV